MGLIDIINPLLTVLRSAINTSQQHQEKNYWERQKLNPEGEKQLCQLCGMQPPAMANLSISVRVIEQIIIWVQLIVSRISKLFC